jgi:putative heme-binding domain-containing protein
VGAAALGPLFEDFVEGDAALTAGNSQPRVRLLFTAYVAGQLEAADLARLVRQAADENVRAIAVRLAVERHGGTAVVQEALAAAAAGDASAYVRLHVAAALQRVPVDQRWTIAAALLTHAEDAKEANLPLMAWYGIEPLAARLPRKAIELAAGGEIPLVREYLARRIVSVYEAAGGERGSSAWILDELLKAAAAGSDAVREDLLRGVAASYRGRRDVAAPKEWRDYYARLAESGNPVVREQALELAVLFGDRGSLAKLDDVLMRRVPASVDERRRALALLATRRDPEFGRRLVSLLRDDDMRADVIRALAAFDLPEIPGRLVMLYPSLTAMERQDVLQTLTARPEFALMLLDAIENEVIPRGDVSALVIRQLETLGDAAVRQRSASMWGSTRPTSAEKRRRISELKEQLAPERLTEANLTRGRLLFGKHCATCHKLFGEGTALAPDLTGAQRQNLDYVLENVIDPSAIVPRDYKVHVVQLRDGRVVQGVVAAESSDVVTLRTANETVHVPVGEIEQRRESPHSMMPEGLFDRLSGEEIRDLVAYLGVPAPVSLSPK